MKQKIQESIVLARSLADVEKLLISYLLNIKNADGNLGYVSGMITSEGPEHIEKNIRILANYTEKIRSANSFPIFSATDVFNDEVHARIQAHTIPYDNWLIFWRNVMRGSQLTKIFMTPKYELSRGAKDELTTAKEMGIEIEYVKALIK